jgi:hypothetical protein
MVKPAGFGPDSETALDNAFQVSSVDDDPSDIRIRAAAEFEAVRLALASHGVEVVVAEGHANHPDDVFPNNWFSTFSDGTLVLYPMKAISRRMERRPEIVHSLLQRYPQLVDLSAWEGKNMFLEGTGSMVLDHVNRIAFSGRSERSNETMVQNWCADFDFDPVLFDTIGPGGKPIYHTNVMLALGTGFAVVCTECIEQPAAVLSALLTTNREIIEITRGQMMNFCGNMLELQGERTVLVMSSTARAAFSATQIASLESHALLVVVDIPTIEKYGGGGIRCMIAELF